MRCVPRGMRFGDAPFLPEVPDAAKAKVMHAQLPLTEAVHLMASDVLDGFGGPFQVGNNVHLSIVASDRAEADRLFAALADGGKTTLPIANAPWGQYFGMCVDRFDVQWMISLPHAVQAAGLAERSLEVGRGLGGQPG